MGTGSAKPDGKGSSKEECRTGDADPIQHTQKLNYHRHSGLMVALLLTSDLKLCPLSQHGNFQNFSLGIFWTVFENDLQCEVLYWTLIISNNVFLITKITSNVFFLVTVLGPKIALISASLSKGVAATVNAIKP